MWGNNYYGQTPSPLSGFYCVVVQSEAEVQNYRHHIMPIGYKDATKEKIVEFLESVK